MIVWAVRAGLLASLCGAPLAAQGVPPWGPPPGSRGISLDAVRPSWDNLDLDLGNGLLYGALRVPVSGTFAVVGEAPVAYFSSQSSSGTVFGNVYVGMEHAGPDGFRADVGVRLPTARQSGDFTFAGLVAFLSDFDRGDAWIDEAWAAQGRIGYRQVTPGGFEAGIRAGPTLWVIESGEDEVFGDYRLHAVYRRNNVAIGGEFSGRTLLTGTGSTFGDLSIHQVTLGVSVRAGAVWPRASLRIPVDSDLKDAGLDHVLGIALDWRF